MRVLLLAGEPSGDRHAAGVARALRRLDPGVEIRAMGGHHLREAGVPLVVDSTRLSVVGLTEVLSRIGPLIAARRALGAELKNFRPDVLVPVDYPDFNLRIAALARRQDIAVAYFVSPQVWAWRPGRVEAIGRVVTRMLVVLPFEVEIYRRAGIPVEHVGHPLLDAAAPPTREEARRLLGIAPGGPVVAILPGSRVKEVATLWPVLREAVRLLRRSDPGRRFIVPVAPGLPERAFEGAADDGIALHAGGAAAVIAACDVAAVASGTATLETALAGRPLVACYRVSRLTIAISRRLADEAFLARGLFALPNVILGREVVPELYQEKLTPSAVAREVERLLVPSEAEAVVAALADLPGLLGGPGAHERTARAILDVGRSARGT